MREQLQMKKKKMIDELRELRKEYKLQNEFNTTIDASSTYHPGRSVSVRKNKLGESLMSTDISKHKIKSSTMMKKPVKSNFNTSVMDADEDNLSRFNQSQAEDYTDPKTGQLGSKKAKNLSSHKNLNLNKSIDNLEDKVVKRRASLNELPGIITEHQPNHFKTKKRSQNLSKIESRNTLVTSRTGAGINSKLQENIEAGKKLKQEELMKAPPNQRKMYTQVFNTYLTPNSHAYAKTKKVLEKEMENGPPKFITHKRHKSVMKGKQKRQSIFDMPDQILLTPIKRKDTPPKENIFTKENPLEATIASCTKLKEGVHHIVINHDGKFTFVEGQCVGVLSQDKKSCKDFTICSCAKGDTGYSNTLSVCVESNDEISKYICSLKPEEKVCICGPTSTECLIPKDLKANAIMIGSGLGVSHFRSFLHKWFLQPEVKYEGQAIMFSNDQQLYKEELEQIKQKSNNQFTYELCDNFNDKIIECGDQVWKLLADQNTHVYLCGSADE